MALSINSEEADRLARRLSQLTGETLTLAVEKALRERLKRETGRRAVTTVREEVARMQESISALPRQREGSDAELIDYDEHGLPR